MRDYNNIPLNIKAFREVMGKSQAEMAREMHRNISTIQCWEAGVQCPRADALLELADYFDVTVDSLYDGRCGD